jgi:hypothetical protein
MAITFSTPVRYDSTTGTTSHSLSNFSVDATDQLLIVAVFHEGTATVVNTVKFGNASLTRYESSTNDRISLWLLANPAVSTANIVTTNSGTNLRIEAFLASGVDLSAGLTSAINASEVWSNTAAGTDLDCTALTTAANAMLIDFAYVNTESWTLSEKSGQTSLTGQQTSGSGQNWTYRIGYKQGGAAGSYTLGYTCSTAYAASAGNAAMALLALKDDSSIELGDLTFTETTANRTPGEDVSWSIAGKTSGSSITVDWGGGVTATTSGTTLTLSGGFTTPGTKLGTPSETLASATNSPRTSPAFGTLVLNRFTGLFMGSSTAEQFFTGATTETPSARLYCGDGSAALIPAANYNGGGGAGRGAGAIAFGNYLLARLGTDWRVDLIDKGVGGTTLAGWAQGYAAYANYASAIDACAYYGGIDAAMIHVGGNDARSSAIPSTATHISRWRSLIDNLRDDLDAPDLPIFLMGTQHSEETPGNNDIYWGRCWAGEMTVADDAHNVMASTAVDLPLANDKVHMTDGATGGMAIDGRRTAQSVASVVFDDPVRHTGPIPGAISYDSATGWATIAFTVASGCALVGKTGQEALTGFSFSSSAGAATPVTEPFVSGTAQVAVALEAGLSGVAYSYHEARNPDLTNPLFDNGFAPVAL